MKRLEGTQNFLSLVQRLSTVQTVTFYVFRFVLFEFYIVHVFRFLFCFAMWFLCVKQS